MAPMLGITDSCYRHAYMLHYGGFAKAVAPFIRTKSGGRYSQSKVKQLKPSTSSSIPTQPQILTNNVDDFVSLATALYEQGYTIINLNMGCPVPTSAGRGRGAGLIPEIDLVDRLLDKTLPRINAKLSVKTRLGLESDQELAALLPVLNRYPLAEIAIHPRTAKQKYSGQVNHSVLTDIIGDIRHEIVYSGDIKTTEDLDFLEKKYPQIKKWMIGRGMLMNPKLPSLLAKTTITKKNHNDFFRKLIYLYQQQGLSDHIILIRLKTLAAYFCIGKECNKKMIKSLRKSRDIDSFTSIFSQTENP